MYRKLKKSLGVLGVIWLLIQPFHVLAQEKLSGTIIDGKDKKPLPGVTIAVQGGRKSLSNAEGKFESYVNNGSILTISMIGYQSQNVKASAGMVVELVATAVDLNDVVILGYGTQKKDLVTGSVVTVKLDDTRRNSPTTSLGNLLAGQMAGVNVGTPDGVPGTAPGIHVRVGTSFKKNDDGDVVYNAQDVLYVIDGKISGADDFNNLSPNDVDNISVLKDAAAAAVYGSRAAGGVVVVTTRTGKKKTKGQINYSFNTGFDKRGKNASLTSAIQTGEIYNRINPGSSSIWTQSDFDYFKNINNGWGYDQLAAVYQTPYITTHNLSASGGSDKITYFIGGSYTKQGTFMKNSTYGKYNLRTNISADITKDLNLFAGITVNNNLSYSPPIGTAISGDDIRGLYRKQLLLQPELPVWTDGGNPIDYGWIGNVGAEVRGDGGYVKSNYIKPVLNLKATYKFPTIEGLSASAQFNKSYTNNRTKYFEKQYSMSVMKIRVPGRSVRMMQM
ncbi:TonB-dependent receptor plug domain-containing protein [Pedobacter sp. NJ-S-72]